MGKKNGKSRKNGKKKAETLTYVGDSGIHGKGLFAARKIHGETLIGALDGKRVKKDGIHVLWVEGDDGKWFGIEVKTDMRFANHSSEPNAGIFNDNELWSLTKIKKDTEITFHYGDAWD